MAYTCFTCLLLLIVYCFSTCQSLNFLGSPRNVSFQKSNPQANTKLGNTKLGSFPGFTPPGKQAGRGIAGGNQNGLLPKLPLNPLSIKSVVPTKSIQNAKNILFGGQNKQNEESGEYTYENSGSYEYSYEKSDSKETDDQKKKEKQTDKPEESGSYEYSYEKTDSKEDQKGKPDESYEYTYEKTDSKEKDDNKKEKKEESNEYYDSDYTYGDDDYTYEESDQIIDNKENVKPKSLGDYKGSWDPKFPPQEHCEETDNKLDLKYPDLLSQLKSPTLNTVSQKQTYLCWDKNPKDKFYMLKADLKVVNYNGSSVSNVDAYFYKMDKTKFDYKKQ